MRMRTWATLSESSPLMTLRSRWALVGVGVVGGAASKESQRARAVQGSYSAFGLKLWSLRKQQAHPEQARPAPVHPAPPRRAPPPWQALYEELQAGARRVFYKETMQGRLQHALDAIKVGGRVSRAQPGV